MKTLTAQNQTVQDRYGAGRLDRQNRKAPHARRGDISLNAHVELPPGDTAPRAARRAVRPLLRSCGLQDTDWLGNVDLVVSELVTNAVRHGGGCPFVNLHAQDGQVTITAADRSTVPPRHRDHADDGGRGLAIIEALSYRWGVHPREGGKQVWVQLPPHP